MTWLRQLLCDHNWSWGERVHFVWAHFTSVPAEWHYVGKCIKCGALRAIKEGA